MSIFVRCVFFFAFVFMSVAADPDQPQTMKKMITRLSGEAVRNDAAAVRPRTLYRAGKKYLRLEEEADPNIGWHRLIVMNEPESWLINLEDQTGRHYVDKGPEFHTKAPIFWQPDGKPEGDFEGLEIGEEKEFFGNGPARSLGTRTVEGNRCKAHSIVKDRSEVILYLDEKTEKPYQIDLLKDGRLIESIRYLSYEAELPFDASLFEPPKSVMIMPGNAELDAAPK
ncbi:MAG: hypothetical protein M3119_11600 [Verrucomicrobiota bacterium]|nr:hypothetical protein [Verrucomicrobiota bacterium]